MLDIEQELEDLSYGQIYGVTIAALLSKVQDLELPNLEEEK